VLVIEHTSKTQPAARCSLPADGGFHKGISFTSTFRQTSLMKNLTAPSASPLPCFLEVRACLGAKITKRDLPHTQAVTTQLLCVNGDLLRNKKVKFVETSAVRRQGFWHRRRPKLRESSAHLVGCIMRRVVCDASVGFRASFV
jgi:hypothetical protein